MNFFKHDKVTAMDWPAQNPNLNPIDNLWMTICGIRYKARNSKTKEELWNALHDVWNMITKREIKNIIASSS